MSDTLERLRRIASGDHFVPFPPGLSMQVPAADLRALLDIAEAAQALSETPEIQMYARHEAVQAGRIGFCARNLIKTVAALDSTGGAER